MMNVYKKSVAVVVISASFSDNDYQAKSKELFNNCVTQEKLLEDKKTLLFFFRKIKPEFLHVVHRFLDITYNGKFKDPHTPHKYMPLKQD